MPSTRIRFTCFPRTKAPPLFVQGVIAVFRANESVISTSQLDKGMTSDQVLTALRAQLVALGFAVESDKSGAGIIERPVFFGENGIPDLRYRIDGYNSKWNCGIEIEAGRAWMGNAVYRDLVQAMVMVGMDHLCLAVPNSYKYKSGGKNVTSSDYDNTVAVADALFGHSRVAMPYGLTIIGY
jgi:hypothetical protein